MDNGMKRRMVCVMLIFLAVVCAVTGKLGYEQIVHAATLENGALNARLREVDVEADRGTIYDRNGEALAISVAVESVYINPEVIREQNARTDSRRQPLEEVVQSLSTILEVDPAEIEEKVNKDASFAYIKRRVTDEQAEALKELDYKGVYFLQESRRSYPKGTLASQVIGFAGIDNQGLSGIELEYDDTLLGNPGKLLVEYDGAGNELPQDEENYIPAEPGSDIYLTLDDTIQYIVERELKEVVQAQEARKATAIVMDVQTCAILGMANYPDFDPNDYNSVDSSLWNNFAVNGLYEPGSTFKILTTAMALEERVTTVDEGFYCPGYVMIGNMRMHCHKHMGHGAESFAQGVANSCNPVFVEVSRRLGMETFYDYLEGFGMTRRTGVDLPGEAESLIVPEGTAVPYDLGAMAIGQSNAFTPIQMVTAISAVANGGKLMRPYIVEKITDPDGNVLQETQPEVVRQVISEDTAREVWSVLETVVDSGTGQQGQIEGYRIAGKTGTAEKVASSGGYSSWARMVSFAGFAPADAPQVACLVIVDEPLEAHGGSTAGPVFQQIMEETLRYLEVPKNVTVEQSPAAEEVTVPPMPDDNPMNAIATVQAAGLNPIVQTQGEVLYTFVPADGTKVPKNGNVYLYCGPADGTQVEMPSLYGHTIKEVDRILSGMGLSATMNGSGLCTAQSIAPGTVVEKGTALVVDFSTTQLPTSLTETPEEAPAEGTAETDPAAGDPAETAPAAGDLNETAPAAGDPNETAPAAQAQQEAAVIWD